LARGALQRGKMKMPGSIVANNKLHKPIAEVAYAVEEDSGRG